MGIKGDLFGKPAQASQSGYGALPGQAQQVSQDIWSRASGLANSADPYSFVPYTAQGQAGINALANPYGKTGGNFNFGQQANAQFGQAANTLGGAGQYFQNGAYNPTGADIAGAIGNWQNPFESSVIGGLNQDYTKSLDQGVNALSAGLGGAFGGDRAALGLGNFGAQTQDNYLQNVGNLRYSGFQSAAQQAQQQLQNDRNAQFTAGQGMTALGGQQAALGSNLFNSRLGMEDIRNSQQGYNQNSVNQLLQSDALQRAPQQTNQQIGLQQLQTLLSSITPFLSGTTGALGETKGALSSGGNGIAGIANAGMQLFSDIRLKENVTAAGTRNGHNWYEFNYKRHPEQRFRGVMAQDIMQTHPWAVVEDATGYLKVNYSMLGLNMEQV